MNKDNKKMTIAVGKFGKSILFNSKKWGAIGGDNEAPSFYEMMFHKNPDINFFLLGLTDFSTLPYDDQCRINKHGNIIDPWKDRKAFAAANPEIEGNKTFMLFMREWTKNNPDIVRSIDCGLFFIGTMATSNVHGRSTKMDGSGELTAPLEMILRYSGPMVEFINETKLDYALIVNDPRYFPTTAKDLFIAPKKVFSQYKETVEHKYRESYTSIKVLSEKVYCDYAAVETIFLIGKDKSSVAEETNNNTSLNSFFFDDDDDDKNEETTTAISEEKSVKFMIVCNEGKPSRYDILNDYILKHIDDVDIYGKWNPETIGNDPRFKGPKKFNDLQMLLPSVKYTFCIPIKPGWATAKFWEMAHYGIIPFVHPSYDEQNNIGFPEFLRVSSSKDLFEKIIFLESNPDEYSNLREQLNTLLRDDLYSGDYLNNTIITGLNEMITDNNVYEK